MRVGLRTSVLMERKLLIVLLLQELLQHQLFPPCEAPQNNRVLSLGDWARKWMLPGSIEKEECVGGASTLGAMLRYP